MGLGRVFDEIDLARGAQVLLNSWGIRRSRSMLGTMTVLIPSRPAYRSILTPSRPSLFIVSRDLPERYNSLAFGFDGDGGVGVIFDRRRNGLRRPAAAPLGEPRTD